jgi:predicted transcriptional regulator
MNTFTVGLVTGFTLFAVFISVLIFNRIHTELSRLATEVDNMNKLLRVVTMKIGKIDQVTQSTMHAAETFVDALRESAQHMMDPSSMNGINPDAFEDLRQSFEEGIKGMEDDADDESTDNPPEPWK